MAKQIAKDISTLEKQIEADDDLIKSILLNDIAPIVEDILLHHIQEDIYGAYSPVRYERRYSLTRSIVTKLLDDNTILVTSNAQPNLPHHGWSSTGDGSFLHMLEVGNMGWWKEGFPRPAISNAQKEADNNPTIQAVINRRLRGK